MLIAVVSVAGFLSFSLGCIRNLLMQFVIFIYLSIYLSNVDKEALILKTLFSYYSNGFWFGL